MGSSSVEDHLFLLPLEVGGTAEVDADRYAEVDRGRRDVVHFAESRRLVAGLAEPYRKQGASMITPEVDNELFDGTRIQKSARELSRSRFVRSFFSPARVFMFHDDTRFAPEKR